MQDRETVAFNIIVPTKNRVDTLVHCLRSILRQDYPYFSIIVSDNCSTDNTREVVERIDDPRVKYICTDRPIGMKENWEFALSHIDGGWVTVIGDDDGLMPGALSKVAEIISTTGLQAITSSWCRYTWPSERLVHSSQLILPLTKGFEVRNARLWLDRVVSGKWRYIELPYIYTGGFVSYDVIRKALTLKDTFFNAVNPDIYSAIAVCSLVEEFVFLKEPIALRGTSAQSTGASTLGSSDNVAPMLEIMKDFAQQFHPQLQDDERPKSLTLYVYECYLQSVFLRDPNRPVHPVAEALVSVAALSSRKDRASTLEYCQRVANRNGSRFSSAGWSVRCRMLWIWLVYHSLEARRIADSMRVDLSAVGINDVNSAAIASSALCAHRENRVSLLARRVALALRDYFRANAK